MKKASSSFLILFFVALLVSFQSYAQISVEIGGNGRGGQQRRPTPTPTQGPTPIEYGDYGGPQSEIRREVINQNLRSYERLRLSDLLRLSYQEQNEIEIKSLSIIAQSLGQGQGQLQILQNGIILSSEIIPRKLKEIRILLPAGSLASGIELSSLSEIYLDSISAEIVHSRYQGPGYGQGGYLPQAAPNALLTLQLNQNVRGGAAIDLNQLAKQQLGVTLDGVQVERVVVAAQPSMYGRSASVQVELNRRLIGLPKYLVPSQRQTPLLTQSIEEVRSLALIVSGDALITEIRVRVGQVRQRLPEVPRSQRIYVGQEVSSRMPLELSRLLPYESRSIRSISVEVRASRYGQSSLEVTSRYGEIVGSAIIGSNSTRVIIQLYKSLPASELRIQSISPVSIDAIEIEFDQYPRY